MDAVYLDARHDYCSVANDLALYLPKVRSGGVVAGDDFLDAAEAAHILAGEQDWAVCPDGSRHPGAVKAAVLEVAERLGVHVGVTYFDVVTMQKLGPATARAPSWYFRKP